MRGLSLPRVGAFVATAAIAATALTMPVFAQSVTPSLVPPVPNAAPSGANTNQAMPVNPATATNMPVSAAAVKIFVDTPVSGQLYDVHSTLLASGFAMDTDPGSSIVAIDLYLNSWPGNQGADFLGRIIPGQAGNTGAGYAVPAGFPASSSFSMILNLQVDPALANSGFRLYPTYPRGGNSLNIVAYGSDGDNGYASANFSIQ